MREVKLLTILELHSLFGCNAFRHTKDKRYRQRYLLLTAVWIFLLIMLMGYICSLSYGLILLGLAQTLPAYLVMLAALLVAALGIFRNAGTLFSPKGYDLLCALPVKTVSVVISRFLRLYAEDFLISSLVLLPGITVHALCIRLPIRAYLILLGALPFLPLIPMTISLAIGSLIIAASSRMKHKSLSQTLLSLLFIIFILIGSFVFGPDAENISPEQLVILADTVSSLISRLYPPAVWVATAALDGDSLCFLLFMLLSGGICAATLLVIARHYDRICRHLSQTSASHDYRIKKLKHTSPVIALYKREARRYFAFSIYVTNTIIGPIMATCLSISLFFVDLSAIRDVFPIPVDATVFLPFVLAGVFTMMTTTAVSLTIEGSQIWLIKTLPVSTKTYLDSKILLYLSLVAPFYLITEFCVVIALRPGFLQTLWLTLFPLLTILFAAVFGIAIDCKLHRFDWEKEQTAVKQSASSMIGGFGGPLLSLFCGVFAGVTPKIWLPFVNGTLCFGITLLTVALYRCSNRTSLRDL